MALPSGDLVIEPARPEDDEEIVALAGTALGWDDTGPHLELFHWKHRDNPFGPSPAWVARLGDRLVGFRTFLRWELRQGLGPVRRVVRAVDTATHPDAQGRGVFTRLTLDALEELRADGVAAVFNTPNDQSRPGYLKMGWTELGRVPIAVIPRCGPALRRMARARQPAAKWSRPTGAGTAPAEFFADGDAVRRLLASTTPIDGLHTPRTVELLRWRYGFAPLHYRCLPAGDRVEDGCLVVRVRARGAALEASVCDVLLPSPRSTAAWRLLASVPRAVDADYAVFTGASAPRRGLPLAGQGPVLTWRPVADPSIPSRPDLALALGDLELF